MFDETYFRQTLLADVAASGGTPVVEVQLLSGHSHRVRSIIGTGTGTVTLETYLTKGDLAHERPRFGVTEGTAPTDTFRAVIAYESIAAVILDASPSHVRARTGFASA